MSPRKKIHPVKSRNAGISPKAKLFDGARKWPTKFQWKRIFKVLTKKEKITSFILCSLILLSFTFLVINFYFKNTDIKPAKGGIYTEGVIGQPRFINPVYANSDVDRDLVQLIFSGLMKYDKNLQIVYDLAENYEIEESGKVYKFRLKENLFWEDNTPLTADDVVFTIKTIQNPDYKSPFRANWIGVEVEKIDDLRIKFTLQKPYSTFLENCTIKILPKHIWQDVSPEEIHLETTYNLLKPIGSGPYKLKKIDKDFITLVPNPLYFGKKPNISEIKFLFFDNEEELIKAAQRGRIKGLSLSSFTSISQPNSLDGLGKNWQPFYISLPRYFAVFFNQEESTVLAEKEVRVALNYGTNKKEIIQKILNLPENSPNIEKAIVHSPIMPEIYGFNAPSNIYEFDIEKAKNILEKAGFKDEDKDGLREKIIEREPAFRFKSRLEVESQGTEVRELQKCLAQFPDVYPEGEITDFFGPKTKQAVIKFQEKYAADILKPWGFASGTGIVGETTRTKLNEVCFESPEEILSLKFSLITVEQPQLVEVANLLKQQWKALGAEVKIEKYSISQLEQDFIKPRNYESLLFGEVLGALPDLLPFWHSSQKKDPGLNLALYENEEADGLLEQIRESSDPEVRAEKLVLFQNILIESAPVVFIYSPDYIYLISNEVKGVAIEKIIDPSKRFSGIENWYIKTKRVWRW